MEMGFKLSVAGEQKVRRRVMDGIQYAGHLLLVFLVNPIVLLFFVFFPQVKDINQLVVQFSK